MKKIFYRALIGEMGNLTPNEAIMYSFLVSKSISCLGSDIFDSNGKLNVYDLQEYLKDNNVRVNLAEFTYKQLSKELNISFQSAMNGIKTLNDSGFIIKNKIFAPPELVEKGYFEIPEIPNLKGLSLIFYSFLKDRANIHGGYIDAYRYKIAELFHVSEPMVKKLLSNLYKLNIIERLENGKLKIN